MESALYSRPTPRYISHVTREALWTEGDVVRKLRIVAGWKLKHLAKRAGVSLTMIHELEMGKTREAKRAQLTRIAAAFGLSFVELLDLVPKQSVRLDISAPLSPGEASVPTPRRRRAV